MSDQELQRVIQNVLSGKTQDFKIIIKQYEKLVFKILYTKLPTHLNSYLEDLAQEVFLTLFDKLSTYNPRYSFVNWIYTIALNKMRNFIKQEGRRTHSPLEESLMEQPTEMDFDSREELEILRQAVNHLPEKYQQVLLFYYGESLKINAIAEILDISENTVKTWLKRAKDKLSGNPSLQKIFETIS